MSFERGVGVVLLAAMGGLLPPPASHAQGPRHGDGLFQGEGGAGTPPPSLEEVVRAAYARHPGLGVMEARRQQATALDRYARSLIAGAPSALGRVNTDAVGSQNGSREYEAGVELPLWRFGQRGAQKRVADAVGEGLQRGRAALMFRVAGEVREQIWELALLRNDERLAKSEWDTAKALEEDVARRVAAGELAKTDLMLAQEETLQKQSAYIQAAEEAKHALENYRAYTGLDRLPRQRGETRSRRSAVAPDHPLLADAHAQVMEAQARLVAVQEGAGGNPRVFLGAKRERASAEEDFDNSIGVILTLPFSTEVYVAPEAAAAARTLAEAQSARDAMMRELEIQRGAAAHQIEATERRLRLAEDAVRIADENLRLARVAFSLGETDLIRLQRVQSQAFAAQRSAQQLKILRQRAIARYNQAVGVLPWDS